LFKREGKYFCLKKRGNFRRPRRCWKIQENYERVWKRLEPKCERNILPSINKSTLTHKQKGEIEKKKKTPHAQIITPTEKIIPTHI